MLKNSSFELSGRDFPGDPLIHQRGSLSEIPDEREPLGADWEQKSNTRSATSSIDPSAIAERLFSGTQSGRVVREVDGKDARGSRCHAHGARGAVEARVRRAAMPHGRDHEPRIAQGGG
jgi:hypothetical protein